MFGSSFFSKDIRDFANFCGRCVSDLFVSGDEDGTVRGQTHISNENEAEVDGYVDNVGYLVDNVEHSVHSVPEKSVFSKDVRDFADFCGRCVSDLFVSGDEDNTAKDQTHISDENEAAIDGYIDNVGYLVDSPPEKSSSFVSNVFEDIESFFSDIGDFVKEEHLPPTPCCVVVKTLLNKLEECLDGAPNDSNSCSYHCEI